MDKIRSLEVADIHNHRFVEKWENVHRESFDILVPRELYEDIKRFYDEYEAFLDQLEHFVRHMQEKYPVSFWNAPPSFDRKSYSDQLVGRILKHYISESEESFDQIILENQDLFGELKNMPEYWGDVVSGLNEYLRKMKGVFLNNQGVKVVEARIKLIRDAKRLKYLIEGALRD